MAPKVCRVVGVAALILASVFASSELAAADQRLTNGGFEQGSTAWAGSGFSTTACPVVAGAAAGNLTTTVSEQAASTQQSVAGAIGPGVYTLTGFAAFVSGAPSASATFSWRNAAGVEVANKSQPLTPSAGYTPFSLSSTAPGTATRLIVRFNATSAGNSTVCLDELILDAPAAPAPTATFTQTVTPTLVPTATPSPTPIPTATQVPALPTSTATATTPPSATTVSAATATATSTVGPGTPTPIPPTPVTTSTSLQFVNGSFEEGLRGWYRYGAELQTVALPSRSGSAGAMSSASTGTKWAYQVVAVDASKGYEFAGFLRTAGAVRSTYLRISWYESLDGSGQAISTDDSLSKPGSTGDTFLYVSTGAIAPPLTARSARLRVMLTPDSSVATVVYLDDFSFITTAVTPRPANKTADPDEPFEVPLILPTAIPTATPRPFETPAPNNTPAAPLAIAAETPLAPAVALTPVATTKALSTAVRTPGRATVEPTSSPAPEVAGVRIEITMVPGPLSSQPAALLQPRRSENHSSSLWYLAGAVLVASIGGAYVFAKRSEG